MENSISKNDVLKKIHDIKHAMLVTKGHSFIARPMLTVTGDGEKTDECLYFFTVYDSNKVEEIEEDPAVLVTYSDPGNIDHISINGHAKILFERANLEKYWEKVNEVFFTDGLDTPNLCLIEVRIKHIEAWLGNKNLFKQAFEFAKGFMTNEKAEVTKRYSSQI